ncbi:MAG: PAS domain-containing protein [Chloroflexota bacterium]|nr:PAS domain-containing protein [Chloroflexota bacterium]
MAERRCGRRGAESSEPRAPNPPEASDPHVGPSDPLFRRIVEDVPAAIAIFRGPEHRFALANPAYRKLSRGKGELVGRTVAEVWPELRHIVVPLLDEVYRTGQPYRAIDRLLPMDLGNGVEETYRSFIYTPLHDGAGNVAGVLVLSQETTDRVRAERRLAEALLDAQERARQEAEARAIAERALEAEQEARAYAEFAEIVYRSLFEGVADAVLVASEDARYVDANEAACALLGYTRDELRSMRPADIVVPSRPWAVVGYGRLLPDGSWQAEVTLRRKDGSLVAVETRARPVRLPTGTVYIGINRDISERKALERLQRDFIAMVTHELRTPLTTLKGYAQMMRRRGAYNERSLETMIDQAGRLERLLGDMIDVSILEAGRLELRREPVDVVGEAADAVEQIQALSHDHQVRLVAPDDPLVAWCDRDRLKQVFGNLLSNAVKYSPEGGEIVVRVEDRGNEVQIAVSDRGLGIAPDVLPRLFGRFYRASETAQGIRGLGLGLYITRSLIEAHGGQIWAESPGPGLGTTVQFTLPYGGPDDPPGGAVLTDDAGDRA